MTSAAVRAVHARGQQELSLLLQPRAGCISVLVWIPIDRDEARCLSGRHADEGVWVLLPPCLDLRLVLSRIEKAVFWIWRLRSVDGRATVFEALFLSRSARKHGDVFSEPQHGLNGHDPVE